VLVNNAGTTQVIPHDDLAAATDEVWRRILDVNLLGAWHLTVAAVPALRSSGDGAVVNISSVAGERPSGSSIPYAVSKAALNHLTLLLARVLGPEIRVNAVAPGLTDTPWTAGGRTRCASYVTAEAPLKRPARPEDIAEAVLASWVPASSPARSSPSTAACACASRTRLGSVRLGRAIKQCSRRIGAHVVRLEHCSMPWAGPKQCVDPTQPKIRRPCWAEPWSTPPYA
jgi:NAD(P)-dependent dehydrogenase (short-subunit alcohol dehydrogenase family)